MPVVGNTALVVTHSTGERTVLTGDPPVHLAFRREDDAVVVTLLAEVKFSSALEGHRDDSNSGRLTLSVTDR
jgi:hypothetical protein